MVELRSLMVEGWDCVFPWIWDGPRASPSSPDPRWELGIPRDLGKLGKKGVLTQKNPISERNFQSLMAVGRDFVFPWIWDDPKAPHPRWEPGIPWGRRWAIPVPPALGKSPFFPKKFPLILINLHSLLLEGWECWVWDAPKAIPPLSISVFGMSSRKRREGPKMSQKKGQTGAFPWNSGILAWLGWEKDPKSQLHLGKKATPIPLQA